MALYLGLDASTQSLTATVIEAGQSGRRVVFEDSIEFDRALPQYRTRHGVHEAANGAVTAPPLMWAEALEAMAARLRDSALDVRDIRAISGAGQQHGSVYLTHDAMRTLSALNPHLALAPQIESIFSRSESPVWLDCSTTAQCDALTAATGGSKALAELTGSRAYERFTAAQVAKFASADQAAYARTGRIHLVSSFMASLLCGADAPLDPADASGMNLMDIRTSRWADAAVAATAPALSARLPRIVPSPSIAGVLAPYWQKRFGFGPARVVTWTGDNPSSLIGLGLVEHGQVGISLGTSDTVFAPKADPAPDPSGAGHVFGSPAGGHMALTCFANGSLARERVRDSYALDWSGFSAALRATAPGNDGAMMIPWFVPEITPTVATPGPYAHQLDRSDAARNVRAVVEGQALAMRLHARWFAREVREIRATGGAAANREILQVLADVFDAEVLRIAPPDAASLGAALRAFHADQLADGRSAAWREVVAGFTDALPGTGASPRADAVKTYNAMLPRYQHFVATVLQG